MSRITMPPGGRSISGPFGFGTGEGSAFTTSAKFARGYRHDDCGPFRAHSKTWHSSDEDCDPELVDKLRSRMAASPARKRT
jgi:hypothetical protein